MALEPLVYPQDLFSYGCKDLHSLAVALNFDLKAEEEIREGIVDSDHVSIPHINMNPDPRLQGGSSIAGIDASLGNWDTSSASLVQSLQNWSPDLSPEGCTVDGGLSAGDFATSAAAVSLSVRRKRRRAKSCKNKEEVENQRMTHIAVERNRRKQMNEYLAVLRSLMPPSYAQRGDQASIIGGAINFVKELEQLLQSLEAQKRTTQQSDVAYPPPFANFFTFPQYSSCSNNSSISSDHQSAAENRSAIADIEVTMVESHANLKVLTKKKPKLLLHMIAGFENLYLTILHLNVTTIDQIVLYSFSVKVEDNCTLTSVDEISTAVYQMVGSIEEESSFN